MDCDDERYYNAPQIQATWMILQKNEKTIELTEEWLHYAKDESILTDIPNKLGFSKSTGIYQTPS